MHVTCHYEHPCLYFEKQNVACILLWRSPEKLWSWNISYWTRWAAHAKMYSTRSCKSHSHAQSQALLEKLAQLKCSEFLDTHVSLAPAHVSLFVRWSVRPSVGHTFGFPLCQRLWSPYVKSWRERTPIIFAYFPKVYFPKVYFPKVYFPKVYFLKVYFLKVYFMKVYFLKVYFPEVYLPIFRAFASLFLVFLMVIFQNCTK